MQVKYKFKNLSIFDEIKAYENGANFGPPSHGVLGDAKIIQDVYIVYNL